MNFWYKVLFLTGDHFENAFYFHEILLSIGMIERIMSIRQVHTVANR